MSFRQLVEALPAKIADRRMAEDLSVHLCFICLLHLANENDLVIVDQYQDGLDDPFADYQDFDAFSDLAIMARPSSD